MSKLIAGLIASGIALAAPAAPSVAAVLGPHATDCAADSAHPSIMVRVAGLKSRTALVRVQSYGGDPAHYFDKGTYIERIDVRPPAHGPVEVCMLVPQNGTYAINVWQDVNGNGSKDFSDGLGFSGNPSVSLMDAVFRRRPSATQVAVQVHGHAATTVIMNYVQGGSVRPIASAETTGR
jgi:uncharacterized protein (DUF2141 family)